MGGTVSKSGVACRQRKRRKLSHFVHHTFGPVDKVHPDLGWIVRPCFRGPYVCLSGRVTYEAKSIRRNLLSPGSLQCRGHC